MVYDTVIGLLQSGDSKYASDLWDAMQEGLGAEAVEFSDENIALWQWRDLTVAGLRCSQVLRQFWVWTCMLRGTGQS